MSETKHQYLLLGACGALIAGAGVAYAAVSLEGSQKSLDFFAMGMGLLGGLALFLFGMGQMAGALKALAGERLKVILAKLTTNRITGVFTGALVTSIIQSSSVTTVLTVGFISAGVLSLSQSVGIIFGSNIGTTMTAQIIAFKITHYALLMVAVGFGMLFIGKADKIKQYGTMMMGLGLVFFGMGLMSSAMKPLRTYQPFLDLMTQMESPLLGILVAAIFTALVQSSSATTGIVIVMASQGLISLSAGIALIFGSNVGTCVTAMLASLGKPREAVRASMVHVLFNICGVLIWVAFIDYLAQWVTRLSPVAAGLSGTDKLAAEMPRQIANAHTIFNIANTLIFLPLAGQFARLAEYLVPDKVEVEEKGEGIAEMETTMQNLDPSLLMMPSLALEQTRVAIGHMSSVIRSMLADIVPAIIEDDEGSVEQVHRHDEQVDALDEEITSYMIRLTRRYLTRDQSEEDARLLNITDELEHIGDVIESNMVTLLSKKIEGNIVFSDEGREEILEYHRRVLENFDLAMEAFERIDFEKAQEVVKTKQELIELEQTYRVSHYRRMSSEGREGAKDSQIHLDLIDYLRRIDSYAESIARTVLKNQELEVV
jgi:phosphate:Na+ symporter